MRKSLLLGLGVGGGLSWLARQKWGELAPQLPEVIPETPVLFQFDYSPYCIKVRNILKLKGVHFEIVELTPMIHKGFTRRMSGQGKVPYLQHRGQIIHDSSQIAAYLETEYPEPSLFPEDAAQVEQVLLLEDWLDESFAPALSEHTYLQSYLNPQVIVENPEISTGLPWLDAHKDKIVPWMLRRTLSKKGIGHQDAPRLRKRVDEVLARLKALLGERLYLVGDHLTLADITLLSHLGTLNQNPELSQDPDFAWLIQWRDRIQAEIDGVQL